INRRFSASLILGAVILTYSHPASTIRIVCSIDPCVSIVSMVVILWMRIGLSAPIGTSPILTSRVLNRLYVVFELQYIPGIMLVFFVFMPKAKLAIFVLIPANL